MEQWKRRARAKVKPSSPRMGEERGEGGMETLSCPEIG